MQILVTGGAGFIGSHLVERLVALGHSVIVLDNFDEYYEPAQKRANLKPLRDRFRLIEGDVRDKRVLEEALAGVDVVVHLAARPGVRASLETPTLYVDNNVGGTQVLLEEMVKRDIHRLVFASSSSVYGSRSSGPFSEADVALKPVSPYAASKLAGEHLCHAAHVTWGMHVNCMRLFTVYGPRQRPEMAIHLFSRLAREGLPIPRFGSGESLRDYTYVTDVVDGLVQAIDRPNGFRIYNLGNDRPISLNGLIEKLATALGCEIHQDVLGDQPGDVPRTWASIERARAELGYSPSVNLEKG
ncbi:MAG: SDR family NAD(P)-dependent oxidoreductase, partial [Planctomycetota bacterium]|nr:SDR family NAD(P)-dependent oxidoreductase [Planctomycetota bacterium]